MKIYLVGGGPPSFIPPLITYDNDDVQWVGIDRGVRYLFESGIVPNMAIGDFDSISTSELKEYEQMIQSVKIYKPEKDETDMELALKRTLQKNPSEIKIFGATGGRIDHLFANIHLLTLPLLRDLHISIELIDKQNIIFIKGPGSYQLPYLENKKYVSFIALSEMVTDLTLEGFKYPLKNRNISLSSTLCISNELILDYGTFSFSEGILMVVRSNDQ